MITLRKSLVCIIAVMLCFCAVFSSLYSVTGNHAAADHGPVETQLDSVSAITASPATEKRYVYDANENKLYYNRVTGMVFSDAGVVYNQDSQPLYYDDETEEFEDSLQRRLDLVERSTTGLQNYYLMFGSYNVSSIGINDTLALVGVKANTAFNPGEAYDILVTYLWVEPWWSIIIGSPSGYYEFKDLHGHRIDNQYLEQSKEIMLLLGGVGTYLFKDYLIKFENWGTIEDLLGEIVYLMELVPPTGSPLGEFALNTETGAFLRDNRKQKIRIKDGQLIDPLGWPLVGSDARPLWWREDLRAYTNHKGELLEYGANNTLTEKNGFIAHSAITEVVAGKRIYLVYIKIKTPDGFIDPTKSGKYLIPATAKTISESPYRAEFYDLNGELVPEWELVEPEVNVDDRKEHWPEEFSTWWEKLVAWFKSYGTTILVVFVAIILLIVLAPFLPAIISFIITLIKLLVKGVVWILTAPFKGIKKLIDLKKG